MDRRSMIKLLSLAFISFAYAGRKDRTMKESDVIIIGGGPAGLTAALSLGRAGRTVIVFDDNKGRNAPAAHMNNFPSRDGTPPGEFRNQMKEDLSKYKEISFETSRVDSIRKESSGFLVNGSFRAKKILLAHGVKDLLPEIPGMKEQWGQTIFFCPYCHGHEFKGKRIGIFANEQIALHMIPLLYGLSKDVVLFTNGEEVTHPLLRGVPHHTEKILSVSSMRIKLEDGKTIDRDCLLHKPPIALTSTLGTDLGCELQNGLYKIGEDSMTTVEGVYAAGDNMDGRASVMFACTNGMRAAVAINFAIQNERFVSGRTSRQEYPGAS